VQRWRRRSARHSLVRFDCAEAAYQFSVSSAAPFARPIDVHHERDDSPAFVFDIMEPDRPKVDRAVLAFLKSEALHPADFTIREDGVVRLNQELARRVSRTAVAKDEPVAPGPTSPLPCTGRVRPNHPNKAAFKPAHPSPAPK
jgi:hypothetical protein